MMRAIIRQENLGILKGVHWSLVTGGWQVIEGVGQVTPSIRIWRQVLRCGRVVVKSTREVMSPLLGSEARVTKGEVACENHDNNQVT